MVYNGVDLAIYSPDGPASQNAEPKWDFPFRRNPHRWRILMVEGSLMGGYEQGLESGLHLASGLAAKMPDQPVELVVAGRVVPRVRAAADARAAEMARSHPFSLIWAGLVDRSHIPELDRSAHILFSSDINAACPNSVVEALACGCPVVAYDTGALPELVTGDSGRLAAYGGDPWKLDPPDQAALVQAALPVLGEQDRFRMGARQRAESELSLDKMVAGYLAALLG